MAGILNKRKEVDVGKHRTPNPMTIDGVEKPASEAVIQRALDQGLLNNSSIKKSLAR